MSPNTTPALQRFVVNQNSWHFRYYHWIRGVWGLGMPRGSRVSGCGYFWTILFFSLIAILCFPLIIFGFVAGRVGASFNSTAKEKDWDKVGRLLDATGFNYFNDKGSERASGDKRSPMLALLKTFFFTLAGVAIILGLLVMLCAVGYGLYLGVPKVPEGASWLWDGIVSCVLWIGWGIFMAFAGIGYGMTYAGIGIKIAAVAVWSVLTNEAVWKWTAIVIGSMLGFSVACFLIVYSFYILVTSKPAKASLSSLDRNLTRFFDWREKRREERAAARMRKLGEAYAARGQEMPKVETAQKVKAPRKPNPIAAFGSWCIGGVLKGLGKFIVLIVGILSGFWSVLYKILAWPFVTARNAFSEDLKIGDSKVKILGIFGLLWQSVVSVKRGACVGIEFLSPEIINGTRDISEKCRGTSLMMTSDLAKVSAARREMELDCETGEPPKKSELYHHLLDDDFRKTNYLSPKGAMPSAVKVVVAQYVLDQVGWEATCQSLDEMIAELNRRKASLYRWDSKARCITATSKEQEASRSGEGFLADLTYGSV